MTTTHKRRPVFKIRKRDGRVVPFDKQKITDAIFTAAGSVGGTDKELSGLLSEKVVELLESRYDGQRIPRVEEVQDLIEYVLVETGHYQTAKAFILYRQKHKKIREFKSTAVDVKHVINEYLQKMQWNVNENSNEQYSFSGLLLHIGGELIRSYALSEMYDGPIADAHKSGHIHIHDLSHSVIGYCAGWSLQTLLKRGFGGIPNKVDCKPAKHMSTVVHQMVNYIGCLQMEWAGAQAFSSVDTLLAPFVRTDKLTYRQLKQAMQQLIFSLNIPSRWGSQYPFSNLTFDWVVPDDLRDEKAIVGGKPQDFTYGDCQKEMDMLNKAFLEVMLEGDAKGRVFTFPIPTYNITKEFNWDNENARILFEVTAKYGLPYFQNYVNSGLDPKSIRAMCCRLNLDLNELQRRPGHTFAMGDSTGSLGVVTVNVSRIAYEADSREDYFAKVKYYMDLGKQSLEIKRKVVQKNLDGGLMPFSKVYLGTLRNHFSTIGLCGMNEACVNFIGKDISSPEGKEFAKETLIYMRNVLKQFQTETGNLYNLEATPAESTSFRFARLDKAHHPDIYTSGDKVPYLTNSTHLPVDKTEDVIEALQHQSDLQILYTGGTMFHTFLGQRLPDGETCKELVKKIAHNTKLPYFSITPTFSLCKEHGYLPGEHFDCPKCGTSCEVYSRIVGYYRPVAQWNPGKAEEYKDRREYVHENSSEFQLSVSKKEDVILETPIAALSGHSTETLKVPKMTNPDISSYKLYTLPGCEKCKAVKGVLSATGMIGKEISLGSDDGLKKFRKEYSQLRGIIKRNSDGSLPVPTVLFYDSEGKFISTVAAPEEIEAYLRQ